MCFANDLSATQTANLAGINRNTISRNYTLIRERAVQIRNRESPLSEEIKLMKVISAQVE